MLLKLVGRERILAVCNRPRECSGRKKYISEAVELDPCTDGNGSST